MSTMAAMKSRRTGRRDDREFKHKPVTPVRSGRTVTDVARDLGGSKRLLDRRVERAKGTGSDRAEAPRLRSRSRRPRFRRPHQPRRQEASALIDCLVGDVLKDMRPFTEAFSQTMPLPAPLLAARKSCTLRLMNRRSFLRNAALAGASLAPLRQGPARAESGPVVSDGDDRAAWIAMLTRVAEPVLANLATNQLKVRMPVEAAKWRAEARRGVTHLEALGRTLGGIAPWLGVTGAADAEEKVRARFAALTRQALANAVDPTAADRLDFTASTASAQNLVDAAFVALGLFHARVEAWEKLDAPVRERLIMALQSTRKFKPGRNNWLLFSAVIEAFLASAGAEWQPEPIEVAIKAHEEWYKGDGAYGDGPDYHWDYYNSYVIQPLLLAVLDLVAPVDGRWNHLRDPVLKRARRYAAVQERLIAPDGSYPPLGRSIAYCCGAFHHLATMALRRDLPVGVAPAQVRSALSAVIRRTLGAPDTFDEGGWLRIGLAGHQPSLGENYISTGSLYLCTFAFLPLGLAPADEFWSAPAADWTSRKLWSGTDLPADHAI